MKKGASSTTPGASASVAPPVAADPQWQSLVLIGIGNFTLLRRQLGRAQSGALIEAVADRVAQCIPDAVARPTAPAQVEVLVRAATRESLDAHLLTLSEVLGHPFALDGGECRIEPVLGAAPAATPAKRRRSGSRSRSSAPSWSA